MIALTDRQRAVLGGLAAGRTQKELARDMDVSLSTITGHVRALLYKFGARTTAHLVDQAHKAGVFAEPANPPPTPAIRRVWDSPDAIRRRRHELAEALASYQPRKKAA